LTYIGQQPATTFDSGIQDRFTGLTTNTVTLTHEISAEEDILVVWNNIVQDKNTYSVGGAGNKTLTLGGALVSADVVTVYYTNKVMQSVNPTANSVGITELNVSDGSNGQALTTNGSGTLSFADVGLSGWSSNSGNLLSSDASKGIYLGVNSATSTNLLHDYEEGTWTPIYNADQGYNTSFTYSTQAGNYTKIGKLVFASFRITATAGVLNGGGGGARIDGLPFDVHDTGEFSSWGGGSAHFFNNMGGNYQAIFFMARKDFDGVYVNGNTSNSDDITYTITNTHIQHNTTLSGQIIYMTDA